MFASESGVLEDWFQLTYDGKDSGQVHLRLRLCEPSEQEEKVENAPLRPDHKSRIVKKSDKKAEKAEKAGKDSIPLSKSLTGPSTSSFFQGQSISPGALISTSATATATTATAPSASSSSTPGQQPTDNDTSSVQRTLTNGRIYRPRSMADLNERKTTIKFMEPALLRIGSRSMEEVRDGSVETMRGGEKQEYGEQLANISSPKQTFTLQDSHGNINQLNLLIAPFDPTWLEPTPPILRRALSAHFYYDDLQTQQASNPREIIPRPQSQQSHIGYPSQPMYMPDGHQQEQQQQQQQQQLRQQQQPPFQNDPKADGYPQQQQISMSMSMSMPMPTHGPQIPLYPQQQQPQQQHLPEPVIMPPNIPNNQYFTSNQSQWSPQPPGSAPYQPHTIFQPRRSLRSKAGLSGNSKHMSLPSRYQLPASQMQQLQNACGGGGPLEGGMTNTMSDFHSQPGHMLFPGSSLGPAAGFLPDTYSEEHQRSISRQLPQPTPPPPQRYPHLGPEPRSNSAGSNNHLRTSIPFPELERPATRNCFYPPQVLSSSIPPQPSAPAMTQLTDGHISVPPIYYASPTPLNQFATFPHPQQHQQQQQQQQQPASGYHRQGSSSMSGESFNTMVMSPAIPMASNLSTKTRDAIFCQYTPRFVSWEGKDIHESVMDSTMGRRILSRYALGMAREKYVREGFYIKEKSPSFADGQTTQQQQQQQQQQQRPAAQRQLQRQFTVDRDGNDRVILKYLKSRRDWEIDCVMMRYLTCQHPEERLESQYMDYPQPQQHCQYVNPFVVGLYETFMHPHGNDYEGCRYLSVLQWFPETLHGYIEDSIASGEGLEVTLPIVRSLIECVDWIHSRRVCHLNIKPSNFVRDPYASSSMNRLGGTGWKLVDFESARVMDEEIVGRCTFSYAAPEILMGNAKSTGVIAKASLDIWSLGLVIYELLTDQSLFKTDDQARSVLLPRADDTSTRPIMPVRYYDCKNISPEYHALLDAMLAHNPEKRPTASQLLRMDLFTNPIISRPVSQDQLIRNNNILSLRDLSATRLCHLNGNATAAGHGEQRRGNVGGNASANSVTGGAFPKQQRQQEQEQPQQQYHQQSMLLEGLGRLLDSPFDQVPRLFMVLPPMNQDMDPSRPFMPTNLFQNKSLRVVILCEGLSGYGEDVHVTDHRGYVLQDIAGFVQDLGKVLLHLIAAAGTNYPRNESPELDRPLSALTGTPIDNCHRWYSSLRSYYETLQSSIQRQVGPAPSLSELRSLRGPTLKSLEQWLVRLVRQQCLASAAAAAALSRKASLGMQENNGNLGSSGEYDGLVDQFAAANLNEEPDLPDVTGPGGGEGYGGLYKMPVGTCGDRWICRGCVSKQMGMSAADITPSAPGSFPVQNEPGA
ncbi:hypothetical protein BGX28_002281 [Mortierella sp. GBA30]|nr:hypothetical protein BGX28_002281 [Mortierella sp. GBA30]